MKHAKGSEVTMDVKKVKNIAYAILLISCLFLAATSGWILTENRIMITIMEILSICSALTIVLFMVELYRASGEDKKSQGLIALILSACMAALTIMNHFIYMTVLNQIYRVEDMPSWLLLDGWPSVTKGLECAAWGFFLGMAMLFASQALEGTRSKVMVWTMRISGIMTLAGLAQPILGNMNYYFLSTTGYSVGFLVLSIELIVYLNQKRPGARAESAVNGLPVNH